MFEGFSARYEYEGSSNQDMPLPYDEIYKYAVKCAINESQYYYSNNPIIKDESIQHIWDNCPNERVRLFHLIVNQSLNIGHRCDLLSSESCYAWLEKMYSYLKQKASLTEEELDAKAALIPLVDKGYDYLDALSRADLGGDSPEAISIRSLGLENSEDPKFFDYCFFKVKRAPGAIDIKRQILFKAAQKNLLSDNLIRAIAKSSPVSLKRLVAEHLSQSIRSWRYAIIRDREEDSAEEFENKIAHAERMIMLFADTPDEQVISRLAECISKDNFPWIMPAISIINSPWLTRRVERALEALE